MCWAVSDESSEPVVGQCGRAGARTRLDGGGSAEQRLAPRHAEHPPHPDGWFGSARSLGSRHQDYDFQLAMYQAAVWELQRAPRQQLRGRVHKLQVTLFSAGFSAQRDRRRSRGISLQGAI